MNPVPFSQVDSLRLTAVNNDPQLRQTMLDSMSLSKIFPVSYGEKGIVRFSNRTVAHVAQPYKKGWNNKGAFKILPEEYQIRYTKVNDEFDPLEFRGTYLSQIAGVDNEIDKMNIISNAYFEDTVKRFGKDIDQALINGKYLSQDDLSATGHHYEICDGLKQIIKSKRAEGKIGLLGDANVVFTEENIGDEIYTMYRALPEDVRESPELVCYMYSTQVEMYKKWYKMVNSTNTDYKGVQLIIDNTEIPIKVLPFGGSSNMVLFTFAENIRILQDNPNDLTRTNVGFVKDMYWMSMHASAGIGFVFCGVPNGTLDEQFVWINANCDFVLNTVNPVFSLVAASDVADVSVTLDANINKGSRTLTATGFQFKKSTAEAWTDASATPDTDGDITKALTGLTPETEYQFRAFCKDAYANVWYSAKKTFTTIATTPAGE